MTPRHKFSKPLKALVVLFVIVAVLHCSVLSGLIRWLAGPSPLDSLLFDGGSGGARPGEGRFSRPVGVGRKPGSDLLKALRQGAVRASASSAEETLGSWHDAVLPQLLSDRPAGLPPPLEGHHAVRPPLAHRRRQGEARRARRRAASRRKVARVCCSVSHHF